MSKAKIEPDNYEFIRYVTAGIGIEGYEAIVGSKSYVKAKRRDGHPDLHIYWGTWSIRSPGS